MVEHWENIIYLLVGIKRLRYWHICKTAFLHFQKPTKDFSLTSSKKPQLSLVFYLQVWSRDHTTRCTCYANRDLDLPSHSYGQFAIGDPGPKWDEWDYCLFFLHLFPKWQNSRANVMANLIRLNKLPSTRVFFAAGKWMVWRTGAFGVISPQNGNLRR